MVRVTREVSFARQRRGKWTVTRRPPLNTVQSAVSWYHGSVHVCVIASYQTRQVSDTCRWTRHSEDGWSSRQSVSWVATA